MTVTINLLTSDKAPVAPTGFRTVVFWWKTAKSTGKMLSPKKYAHVPVLTIPGVLDDKSQQSIFFRDSVEEAQNNYLKSIIEAHIEQGSSITEFQDSVLTLTAMFADYYSARKTGGRLDGDTIEEWFISEMAEVMLNAVMTKLPNNTDEQNLKIVQGYQDKYKKLASGAVKYPVVVAKNLLENIQKVTTESVVKDKLIKRLEGMTVEVTAESEGLI